MMDGDLDLPGNVAGARIALGSAAALVAVALGVSRRRLVFEPLVDGLDRLSETVLAFERWVVDPLTGALATLVVASAWAADVVDAGVLGAPADAVARGLVRAASAVRPVVGGSLVRVFWAFVAFFAVACVGHGLWPVR
jgi:hypothetical protein